MSAGGESESAINQEEPSLVTDDVVDVGGEHGSSDEDDGDSDPLRDLRAEAISTRHLLTHRPKNRYCKACVRCKMQRSPCRLVLHPTMALSLRSLVTFALATISLPTMNCLVAFMAKKKRS